MVAAASDVDLPGQDGQVHGSMEDLDGDPLVEAFLVGLTSLELVAVHDPLGPVAKMSLLLIPKELQHMTQSPPSFFLHEEVLKLVRGEGVEGARGAAAPTTPRLPSLSMLLLLLFPTWSSPGEPVMVTGAVRSLGLNRKRTSYCYYVGAQGERGLSSYLTLTGYLRMYFKEPIIHKIY